MKSMKTNVIAAVTLTAVISCATTPEEDSAVSDVRAQYDMLASHPDVQQNAPRHLNEAKKAVVQAERAASKDADRDVIDHYVYLAERRIAIADEAADLERAEKSIRDAEARRGRVMLNVREAQASRAEQRAQTAEERAKNLEQELSNLEGEVDSLKTQKTDEGIVLTLSDILFNVNEDKLRPGANRTLDEIANFLSNYENRQLEIKGFTDSTGSASYNQQLSERRAQSVKQALVARGISSNRIDTVGYGERFPIASNDTSTGRQQNRRVEILIPDTEESVSGINE